MCSRAQAGTAADSVWPCPPLSILLALLSACLLSGCAVTRGREYARYEGGWYAPPGEGVTVAVGWVYGGSQTQTDVAFREYLASALRDALSDNALLHAGTTKPELTLFCHIRRLTRSRGTASRLLGDSVSLGVLCGVANSSGELVALLDVGRGVHGAGYYTDAWRRACRAVARDVADGLVRGEVIRPGQQPKGAASAGSPEASGTPRP